MTDRGSRDDLPHPRHQESGQVGRSNCITPTAGAAKEQDVSFPECTKHKREECEKRTKDKLGIVRYVAYSHGNDWHRSEDFAQDVAIRIAKSGKTMCEVTTHYCLKTLSWVTAEHWRKKHDLVTDDVSHSDEKSVYEADAPPWLKSLRTATKEALDALPQRQRQVVIARFIDDKTVDEVCEELTLPARVVHNYTALGLTRLRPLLEGKK